MHAPRYLRQAGFSLIELIMVLGIMGAVAAVILPNIGLTMGSQMALSLKEFTTALRSTYDAAILTGQIHRLVINPGTGEYWAEAAPPGYTGRPPLAQDPREDEKRSEELAKLHEQLEAETAEVRKSAQDDTRNYSQRNIMVVRRDIFKPVKWNEVNDPVLFKRKLSGSAAFAGVQTDSMAEKLDAQFSDSGISAYIYFYPSGEAQQSIIYLGAREGDRGISEDGPRYTIKLDPLTGQSQIQEGFQDAEFTKAQQP